jgi:uncharacterized protein with LGFP repeats
MLQKKLLGAVTGFVFLANIAAASQAIDAKYKSIGAATLGKPAGREKASTGGRVRLYANGGIYSSKAAGTHAVYGPAFDKYKSLGAEKGKLGFPVTDVLTTADGGTQTLFRHGYVLVDKAGAASADVTPKATFTADSVTYTDGAKAAMKSATEAILAPESPAAGGTVTCNCSKGSSLEIGMCAISPAGISSIRCQKGTCRNSCVITIVKGAQ